MKGINHLIKTSVYFVVLAATSSCGKKWKQTTNVEVDFEIASSYSTLFNITSCNIEVGEIDFSGDRKQGGNVSFADAKSTPSPFILNIGSATSGVQYDIPQGVYTYISLHLNVVSQSSTPSISISGIITQDPNVDTISISPPIYISEASKTIPMIFEYHSTLHFDLNATTTNGSSEITLVEGTPATCNISLDPYYWLATITKIQFKKASRDTINGISTVLINESHNRNIYDSVVIRINENAKAVFNQ
jgi:hypothetical protein